MIMHVEIEIMNLGTVLDSLKKQLEAGLQPAVEAAKTAIENKFQNNPSNWRPLSASTIYQRSRLGFGAGPILYRTGRLQGQAVQQMQIHGDTGTLSTSDPIAIIQDKARPIYQFSDEEKAQIFEAFKAGLK